jgi:hypothetical protein
MTSIMQSLFENLLLVRIILSLIYSTVWIMIVKKKGKSIWESIIGEDKILQISELVVLCGIIAYIIMLPADAFWGIVASKELWMSIDAIVMTALGLSTYLKTKEIEK